MPMPAKREKETKEDFISRFMGDEAMKKEFPDEKQRLAVAYSKFRENDAVSGGLADNKTVEDIAQKHGVPIEQIRKQMRKGIEVEMEHTDKETVAGEIARDHLWEMADYYDKLSKMEKKNALQLPEIYYVKHIEPGVAEYREGDKSERLLVTCDTLKSMMPSFVGKPAYVLHQEVDISKLQEKADGYICESFYNEVDGWFWLKMIVVSDEGHRRIKDKWSVSNAYSILSTTKGGMWHDVKYDYEVIAGAYTHLAIVPNPRYEGAAILTPDEFKAYNEAKKRELVELTNSKEKNEKGGKSMFKFFKTQKEEVPSEQILNHSLEIEGRMVSVEEMAKITADHIKNEGKGGCGGEKGDMYNMDSEIDLGDGEKETLKDILENYKTMRKNKKNAEEEEEEKEKKEKENEEEKEKEEKKNSIEDVLKSKTEHINNSTEVIETSEDRVSRGKARYGSGK